MGGQQGNRGVRKKGRKKFIKERKTKKKNKRRPQKPHARNVAVKKPKGNDTGERKWTVKPLGKRSRAASGSSEKRKKKEGRGSEDGKRATRKGGLVN